MRYRTFDGFNGALNLHEEIAHLFSSALLEFPGQEPRDFAPVLNFSVPRAHQNLNICVVFDHWFFSLEPRLPHGPSRSFSRSSQDVTMI
jgi:hypothetical protein